MTMEAIQNTSGMQIQNKIRNDAEDLKNVLNDLYNWQKDVKDKEQKLEFGNEPEEMNSEPIRSHIDPLERLKEGNNSSKIDIGEERRKVKIEVAETLKERGNKFVKLGEYERAIEEYTAALGAFDGDPKYYTNRALCYLKLEKYHKCIDDCDRAIEIDNLSVKAYYRRMQANECLGFNTRALKDCTTVLMIDPKNSEAIASLQRINQRLKKTGAVPKGYPTTESNTIREGPNFSPLRTNMCDILPTITPPYARSKKPLKRIPITDVIGPKDGKNFENSNIQISDEVIDKLFNGECGSYEEVKKTYSDQSNVIDVGEDSNKVLPNKIARKKVTEVSNEVTKPSAVIKDRPLPPPPISTAQFYCNWKELTTKQKYEYLKSIKVSQLQTILGASFDSQTLSDLLLVLKEDYVPNKENACEVLLAICKHNRLPILSLLLSTEDKAALSDVLNYIMDNNGSLEQINLITKSFNFK